jgi:hypothetical protein
MGSPGGGGGKGACTLRSDWRGEVNGGEKTRRRQDKIESSCQREMRTFTVVFVLHAEAAFDFL